MSGSRQKGQDSGKGEEYLASGTGVRGVSILETGREKGGGVFSGGEAPTSSSQDTRSRLRQGSTLISGGGALL